MKVKQVIENFLYHCFGNKESNKEVSKECNKELGSEARRSALTKLIASSGAVAMGVVGTVQAHRAVDADEDKEERFPGDPPEHFIVYQFNHAEQEYHQHILGSAGAMIAKYDDNVDIVVACFGKGIHILAKNPVRPVDDAIKEKVKSLAGQGVKFHACGRTLQSLQWSKDDLLPFAILVDVGVADIMELQEKNYAYMAW
ncbi:MAG: DsrE family protein [gamma proteobacterium symbiont of Taylorina sp.]|nr:DsrE family protein [gamma proteobacterium symbiont of Taylorina sp.]